MASIAGAVTDILASSLPVLFVDTCVLVDVIRAPMRPRALKGCVRSAVQLADHLTADPGRCRLAVASFVPGEWREHAARERDRLRDHLTELDEYGADFHLACADLNLAPAFGKPDYSSVGLPDRLFGLSELLMNHAIHLDAQDETNMRAFGRAIKCTPPSKKGGEAKDCTIVEECLETCRRLQSAGFSRSLVYCTSNTQDYCEGRILHPALGADFSAVDLAFTTNLPWEFAELMK
jgi:hypothetical protein